MNSNRRAFLKGMGGALALPMLESHLGAAAAKVGPPLRFLVVGNPFGAHPTHFFPKDFGKDFSFSPTLRPLTWLRDRLTVLSHTDHNMVSGHGREISFLSGVLPFTFGVGEAKIDELNVFFFDHLQDRCDIGHDGFPVFPRVN